MVEQHTMMGAPRNRWIMLHGGGWVCPKTGEHICEPAVARWISGVWAMRDSTAPHGYEAPDFWSEIEPGTPAP